MATLILKGGFSLEADAQGVRVKFTAEQRKAIQEGRYDEIAIPLGAIEEAVAHPGQQLAIDPPRAKPGTWHFPENEVR